MIEGITMTKVGKRAHRRTRPLRYGAFRRIVGASVVTVSCVGGPGFVKPSWAEELTFTLDPLESHVSASAEITLLLGAPLDPQGPGADTTSYSGSILVDVDDPRSPSSIEFRGGSVAGAVSGDWLPEVGGGTSGSPGAPQPANYGLTAERPVIGSLWLAFRDLVLSPESPPLSVSEGEFTADQTIMLESGAADYAVRSLFYGDRNAHEELAGEEIDNIAAEAGSYLVDDGIATLRLPVELLVAFQDEETGAELLELTFSGSVTATAALAPSPTADIDADGDVDGDDLLDMLLGFGIGSGAALSDGDADFDGDVDRADVQVWREQAGSGTASRAATAIPEPSAVYLALGAVMALFGAGRLGRHFCG